MPYYYETKDALLAAAVEHITEAELALLRGMAGRLKLGTVTPHEASRAVAELLRTLLETDRGARIGHLEAMLHAARREPPLEAARVWWEANVQLARVVLEQAGQAEPDIDARILFAAGFGLYFAELTAQAIGEDGTGLAECLERLFAAMDTRGR